MPWHKVMEAEKERKEMSLDDLAYEARSHGASAALTGSQISQVKHGRRPLSPDLLEGIAGALGISPTVFVEYRLARARQLLDERDPPAGGVGLEEAAKNLDQLNGALGDEAPDRELDRLAEEQIAASRGQPPEERRSPRKRAAKESDEEAA